MKYAHTFSVTFQFNTESKSVLMMSPLSSDLSICARTCSLQSTSEIQQGHKPSFPHLVKWGRIFLWGCTYMELEYNRTGDQELWSVKPPVIRAISYWALTLCQALIHSALAISLADKLSSKLSWPTNYQLVIFPHHPVSKGWYWGNDLNSDLSDSKAHSELQRILTPIFIFPYPLHRNKTKQNKLQLS